MWDRYIWFALSSVACCGCSIFLLFYDKKILSRLFLAIGFIIICGFIACLWLETGYPPFRTMGELRLWYSVFLIIIAFVIYRFERQVWLYAIITLLSSVFLIISIFKPQLSHQTLPMALRSIWFIPHVLSYMIAYAALLVATISSYIQLYKIKSNNESKALNFTIDRLVYIGTGFIIIGILTGSVWAKEIWGFFWMWDLKETWALITLFSYTTFIHLRLTNRQKKATLYFLTVCLLLLMITWLGVDFLPGSSESKHTYS